MSESAQFYTFEDSQKLASDLPSHLDKISIDNQGPNETQYVTEEERTIIVESVPNLTQENDYELPTPQIDMVYQMMNTSSKEIQACEKSDLENSRTVSMSLNIYESSPKKDTFDVKRKSRDVESQTMIF